MFAQFDNFLKSWRDLITDDHYQITRRFTETLSVRYPRRSCDAFASAVLQNEPWAEMPMPRFKRLQKLQRWCWQLVAEETEYYENGTPMTRFGRGAA
jgi:hypothetical protein